MRRDEVLFDGEMEQMRHLKSEVDTIKKDLECGLRLKGYEADVGAQMGDTVVCYTINKKPQETEWDPGF
jgi:translation initiation factor IF-2